MLLQVNVALPAQEVSGDASCLARDFRHHQCSKEASLQQWVPTGEMQWTA